MLPQATEAENPELTDFRRRLLVTLPLTLAVVVVAMAGHRIPGARARSFAAGGARPHPNARWSVGRLAFFQRWLQSI